MTKNYALFNARKEAGMTQKELAEKAGLAQCTICFYENLSTSIKKEHADKIAVLLEKQVDELFEPEHLLKFGEFPVSLSYRSDCTRSHSNYSLRQARAEQKCSLKKLSKKTGIHWVVISLYEGLRRFPSGQNAEKIAKALNKTAEEIFPKEYKILSNKATNPEDAMANAVSLETINEQDISLNQYLKQYHEYGPEHIQQALNKLLPQERRVIELKYGLDENSPCNNISIGKRLNLSHQRISQIHHNTLNKIQAMILKKLNIPKFS